MLINKDNLKKIINSKFPTVFFILKSIKKIFFSISDFFLNHILHINLSNKRKGASIILKEKGFILSFIFDNYFTFHLKPKKFSDFKNISTFQPNKNELAIIIQGNIGNNINFLIETLKIYKIIFPNTLIIVSTWEDEKKDDLKLISELGIDLILNKKPEKSGFGNINLQIISTKSGLDLAKNKNVKYCIKTRPDCRMNKNDIYPFLKGLVNTFPLKNNMKAHQRVFASSVNTCKYKIYGTTDILLFGYIDDLLIYFEDTLFDESLIKYNFGTFPSIINSTPVVAETFLCARYLKNLDVKLEWTLEHWWECLKNYFCIIDADSLDFLWKKKDWQYEKRFLRSYSSLSHRSVNFSDWLGLYNEGSLNWRSINYQEKWEINKNFKYQNDEIFIKKSIF